MTEEGEQSGNGDADLIARLLKGEQQAFRELIRSYQSGMLTLARSIAGSSIAEEIVQEAWVSVLKALPGFEGRSSLKTWLYRIVANQAKTRLRKESRTISLNTDLPTEFADRFDDKGHWSRPPVTWDTDTLLTSAELKDCLDLVLKELPALQSAALLLREQQGYTTTEICNILEVSESNIRVLLHRARSRLFEVVEHFQLTGTCCARESLG